MAGVTVGVMALIIVIAVMAGFESDLKSRILGVQSHLVIMRSGSFTDYDQVLESIQNIDGVEAASPFIYTQVMLRSSKGVSGAVLKGVDPELSETVIKNLDGSALKLPSHEKDSKDDKYPGPPGIVLGGELAKKMRVRKGSIVHVISPGGMISPVGHLPGMKRFEVTGFFESGMYEFDGSLAYVNIRDAAKILRMSGEITGIEARVDDIDDVKNIAREVRKKLGFPYWTKDWTEMNQNLFSALKLEKIVMFIILALIILVAAFNIASSLIMMVMQKTKDIAILKAMGATDRSIRKIFVLKGMAIGSLGTGLGVVIGCVVCGLLKHYKFIELPGDVYYISTLPVQLEFLDVSVIAISALAICFLATLYPANQAAKLNPVDAFRYG